MISQRVKIETVVEAEESPSSPPWKSISFAIGGWLQFYMYGVARAIQARGLDSPDVTYCGASAGALAAAGLVLEGDFDAAVEFCKAECVPQAHGHISGLFRIDEYVAKCLELHLVPKYKTIRPEMLQIAITRLPWLSAERVVEYLSRDDLTKCLLASSAAFPICPLIFHRGTWCIDGGLSDFQPVVDDETVTVSPFYFSNCDIKPSRYVPLWWAFLPPKSNDTIDWLYNLGFQDAMDYFDRRKIPSTPRARPGIQEFAKNPHPYDTPRRVSIHRFLGYDLGNLTHEYVSFTMDFFLLLLLMLVWKPIALSLIYTEVLMRMVMLFLTTLTVKILDILFITACRLVFIDSKRLQCPSQRHRVTEMWECFTCVWSLSLLLRFFTPTISSVELRKHDRLAKVSVLYRIFRHMI